MTKPNWLISTNRGYVLRLDGFSKLEAQARASEMINVSRATEVKLYEAKPVRTAYEQYAYEVMQRSRSAAEAAVELRCSASTVTRWFDELRTKLQPGGGLGPALVLRDSWVANQR